MGFLNIFKQPDINAGVDQFQKIDNAVLIDVRTEDEYKSGHIEGSINIPLQNISDVQNRIKELNTPIFVHCLSGGRSAKAASALKSMGYTNVTNIGGINGYRGKVV